MGQSTKCQRCGGAMSFYLELIREGKVLDCHKCVACSSVEVHQETGGIPREVETRGNLLLVRFKCRNVYIFDRALFYDFTRAIIREVRSVPRDVCLNLRDLGYISDVLLRGLSKLQEFLAVQGRELRLISDSAILRESLEALGFRVRGCLFPTEEAAVRSLAPAGA